MHDTSSAMTASSSGGADGDLAGAIGSRLREGRLPCAEAFALAHERHVAPLEVAQQAAAQGVRIGWCQLGLFVGAVKHDKAWPAGPFEVPAEVQAAITAALEDGVLTCPRAWGVAKALGQEKMYIGQAADAMGVRILQCQLGCF